MNIIEIMFRVYLMKIGVIVGIPYHADPFHSDKFSKLIRDFVPDMV